MPAFMLTIEAEQMPRLFKYYKNTLRPSALATESDEKNDSTFASSSTVKSVESDACELDSIDSKYFADFRDRDNDRSMQLELLV